MPVQASEGWMRIVCCRNNMCKGPVAGGLSVTLRISKTWAVERQGVDTSLEEGAQAKPCWP